MANVLCIYENKIATVSGLESYFYAVERRKVRISVKFLSIINVKNSDLSWCDVLFMIRPNNAVFDRIAKLSKKFGILVVCYSDDDLMHLPCEHPDMPWRKKSYEQTLKKSDIFISSSQYLCSKYIGELGVKRAAVLNTAVPSQNIKEHIDGRNNKIKIVYAAGISHKSMFDRFISPILGQIDEKCGEKISLTFMGVKPDIKTANYRMQINYIEPLSFEAYRARIEMENFDIGLAPLVTSDFSKCKYFNKFIEYAMFGIVGLYSNTEPYTNVIKNRINGILVQDNSEEWLKAIVEAVNNDKLINECRVQAYNVLEKDFSLDRITNKLVDDIPELVEMHVEKHIKSIQLFFYRNIYLLSRICDWIYKAGFYFRKGGIIEVFDGIRRLKKSLKLNANQKEKVIR